MNVSPQSLTKILIILFSSLGLSQVSMAQEEEQKKPQAEPVPIAKNYLKFSPIALMEGYNAAFEMNYERRMGQVGLQGGFGYLYQFQEVDMESKSLLDRYRLRGELRYYISDDYGKSGLHFGSYLAVEGFYLKRKIQDVATFERDEFQGADPDLELGVETYEDSIGIDRQTYGTNFKLGIQMTAGHFTAEIYTGIGLKFREVTHTGRLNPEDEMEGGLLSLYAVTHDARKNSIFNVPMGFRLGFAF